MCQLTRHSITRWNDIIYVGRCVTATLSYPISRASRISYLSRSQNTCILKTFRLNSCKTIQQSNFGWFNKNQKSIYLCVVFCTIYVSIDTIFFFEKRNGERLLIGLLSSHVIIPAEVCGPPDLDLPGLSQQWVNTNEKMEGKQRFLLGTKVRIPQFLLHYSVIIIVYTVLTALKLKMLI